MPVDACIFREAKQAEEESWTGAEAQGVRGTVHERGRVTVCTIDMGADGHAGRQAWSCWFRSRSVWECPCRMRQALQFVDLALNCICCTYNTLSDLSMVVFALLLQTFYSKEMTHHTYKSERETKWTHWIEKEKENHASIFCFWQHHNDNVVEMPTYTLPTYKKVKKIPEALFTFSIWKVEVINPEDARSCVGNASCWYICMYWHVLPIHEAYISVSPDQWRSATRRKQICARTHLA